ncbi:retinitis pigmentosa 1-like 1 protein [Cyrtonyx montezumae]|uniref:retinitis pigmentosa 1-like 1 protein n=1 Tax=Cyrtonyx montezumae TaxID=9017 RepID=UPI0032DB2716
MTQVPADYLSTTSSYNYDQPLPSVARTSTVTQVPPAKKITFFKSGDPQFGGVKMAINQRSFKSFNALMDDLSHRVPLPFGVRTITTPRGIHCISELDQLEDGGCYLCSDKKYVKPINITSAGHRPGPPRNGRPSSTLRRAAQEGRLDDYSTTFTHHGPRIPKKITLVKNGETGFRRSIILNRRNARSFKTLLDEISEILQFPVKKLFTVDGKKIDSMQALLHCPNVLVCVGREPFKPVSMENLRKHSVEKLPDLAPRSNNNNVNENNETNFELKAKKSIIHPRSASSNRSMRFSLSSEKSYPNGLAASPDNGAPFSNNCSHTKPGDLVHSLVNDDIEKRVHVNKDGSLSVEMKVRFRLLNDETLQWSTQIKKSNLMNRMPCEESGLEEDSGVDPIQKMNPEASSEADDSLYPCDVDSYMSKLEESECDEAHCHSCGKKHQDYDIWKNPMHTSQREEPSVRSTWHTRSSCSSTSSRRRVIHKKKASVDSLRTTSSEEFSEHIVQESSSYSETIENRVAYRSIKKCTCRSDLSTGASNGEDQQEYTRTSTSNSQRPSSLGLMSHSSCENNLDTQEAPEDYEARRQQKEVVDSSKPTSFGSKSVATEANDQKNTKLDDSGNEKVEEVLEDTGAQEELSDLMPSSLPNASPEEVVQEWLSKIPSETLLMKYEMEDNEEGECTEATTELPCCTNAEEISEDEKAEKKNAEEAENEAVDEVVKETVEVNAVNEEAEEYADQEQIPEVLSEADKADQAECCQSVTSSQNNNKKDLPTSVQTSVQIMKALLSSKHEAKFDRSNSLPEVSPTMGRKLSNSATILITCLASLQLLDEESEDPSDKSKCLNKTRYVELLNIFQALWFGQTGEKSGPSSGQEASGQEKSASGFKVPKSVNGDFTPMSSSGVDVSSGSGGSGEEITAGARECNLLAQKTVEFKSDGQVENGETATELTEAEEQNKQEEHSSRPSTGCSKSKGEEKANSTRGESLIQDQCNNCENDQEEGEENENSRSVENGEQEEAVVVNEALPKENLDEAADHLSTTIETNVSDADCGTELKADVEEQLEKGSTKDPEPKVDMATSVGKSLVQQNSVDPDPVWVLRLLKKIEKEFMAHYVNAMNELKVKWNLQNNQQMDEMILELKEEVSKRIQRSIEKELRKIRSRAGAKMPRPPDGPLKRESTLQTEQRRRRLQTMHKKSFFSDKTGTHSRLADTSDLSLDVEEDTAFSAAFEASISEQPSEEEYCPCDTCVRKKMASKPTRIPVVASNAPVVKAFDLQQILRRKKDDNEEACVSETAQESKATPTSNVDEAAENTSPDEENDEGDLPSGQNEVKGNEVKKAVLDETDISTRNEGAEGPILESQNYEEEEEKEEEEKEEGKEEEEVKEEEETKEEEGEGNEEEEEVNEEEETKEEEEEVKEEEEEVNEEEERKEEEGEVKEEEEEEGEVKEEEEEETKEEEEDMEKEEEEAKEDEVTKEEEEAEEEEEDVKEEEEETKEDEEMQDEEKATKEDEEANEDEEVEREEGEEAEGEEETKEKEEEEGEEEEENANEEGEEAREENEGGKDEEETKEEEEVANTEEEEVKNDEQEVEVESKAEDEADNEAEESQEPDGEGIEADEEEETFKSKDADGSEADKNPEGDAIKGSEVSEQDEDEAAEDGTVELEDEACSNEEENNSESGEKYEENDEELSGDDPDQANKKHKGNSRSSERASKAKGKRSRKRLETLSKAVTTFGSSSLRNFSQQSQKGSDDENEEECQDNNSISEHPSGEGQSDESSKPSKMYPDSEEEEEDKASSNIDPVGDEEQPDAEGADPKGDEHTDKVRASKKKEGSDEIDQDDLDF